MGDRVEPPRALISRSLLLRLRLELSAMRPSVHLSPFATHHRHPDPTAGICPPLRPGCLTMAIIHRPR